MEPFYPANFPIDAIFFYPSLSQYIVETESKEEMGNFLVRVSNIYPDGYYLSTTFTISIWDKTVSEFNPFDNAEVYEEEIENDFLPEIFVQPEIIDITHRGEVTITFSEPVKANANLTLIKNNTKIEMFDEKGENKTELIREWVIIGQSSAQLLLKVSFTDYKKVSANVRGYCD